MDWLTEGLSVKGMASFDYNSYDKTLYQATFATYELNNRDDFGNIDAYNRFDADGELAGSKDSYTIYKLYMEAQINYARKFGRHDVTAMVLYNQNDYRYRADLAKRYQGLVGRATYGYDDRYLAEVNLWVQRFGKLHERQTFWFLPRFLF